MGMPTGVRWNAEDGNGNGGYSGHMGNGAVVSKWGMRMSTTK